MRLGDELKKQPDCDILARELQEYILEDDKAEQLHDSQWPTKIYKDLMAGEVAEAIRCGKKLYLACLDFRGPFEKPRAIFVGLGDDGARMFTSWSHGVEEDERHRTRHVSLQVAVTAQASTSDPPLIHDVEWVNGLAFFRGKPQRGVIVRWPDAWTQQAGMLTE